MIVFVAFALASALYLLTRVSKGQLGPLEETLIVDFPTTGDGAAAVLESDERSSVCS